MARAQDDPRSDRQLIAAINYGDVAAFEVLYRRYRDWVVNLAYRFTGDREMALDVMQETFTYVLRKCPGFRLTARFTTFLYPVVHHLAISQQRKARRHQSSAEALRDVAVAGPPVAPDTRDELSMALARLSDDHREVLLMRFVDDMTHQEIADALQVPLGTVKSRVYHAIRTLRADPAIKIYFED